MRYIALLYSVILVGVDQILKYIAIDKLTQVTTYPIIDKVLHLTYTENTGAAFNSFDGNYVLLIVLPTLFLFVGVLYLCFSKKITPIMMWCIATVVGGGLGNVCDRIFRGFVVDYIDLRIINFAIFNFADMCVVVGAICMVLYVFITEYKLAKSEKQSLEKRS